VRTESEMTHALAQLQELKKRSTRVGATGNREYNPAWHTALDLKNLLTVSEAITRAALERKESRGAQFREDYPDKDEHFGNVNTTISKSADGSMQIRLEPLPEMPDYLRQIIEEMK
jgi:succinate dehydrogenase / fumarate reductase flavoprotein subunit